MPDVEETIEKASIFPVNSAILIFEQGTPEFVAASRASDITGALHDILDDLRKVVKYDTMQAGEFDFSPALSESVSRAAVETVVDHVRSGIYKTLGSRNIDIDLL